MKRERGKRQGVVEKLWKVDPPPPYFLYVLIPKDFKFNDFVSMDSKGVRGAFFVSMESKGVR